MSSHTILKEKLMNSMEELYGGAKDLPQCNEENEEAIIEIWNQAVEKCIDIVKQAIAKVESKEVT